MKKLFFLITIFSCLISQITNAQQNEATSNGTMDPKAASYYNSAIQFMKAEQYENAISSIDSSLMIAKDYRAYQLQGQAYQKLGKTPEALNSFNESVKLNPEYDMGWMSLGNANLASK